MNTGAATARAKIPETFTEDRVNAVVGDATVMVQIRNVPESLHRALKSKAALEGISLSDLILREISDTVEKPTMNEWLAEIERNPIRHGVSSEDIVSAIREMRGELPA